MTARRSSVATHQLWAERISRFNSSGVTVAKFCDTEGCSQASLYYWRRKLTPETTKPQSSTSFVPVKLLGSTGEQAESQDGSCNLSPSPLTVMTVKLPGDVHIRIEVASTEQVIK